MSALPAPRASTPIMYGEPAPPGELLPWEWARGRLTDARDYWVATVRGDGRPHSRPVWGVWLDDEFWFSTGSLARRNLATNPEITVHLGGATEVVIVEGTARPETSNAQLQGMCDLYSPKYDFPISPIDGEVRDPSGIGGPVYVVRPRAVFAWDRNMKSPTRWTFE